MQEHGYKDLARIYDVVYRNKDYAGETLFIEALLKKHNVKSVLDAGCGTGSHMKLLEDKGFICTGLDLNMEMLDVARAKVKGELINDTIIHFDTGKKYDAIVCMFATFNHLLTFDEAGKALVSFRRHLNPGGMILIDLHNPQGNGRKDDNLGSIRRVMEWTFDKEKKIEESRVVFTIDKQEKKVIEDRHTMRIYSIREITELIISAGFSEVAAFEGYGMKPATQMSKNIEIFARL